MGATASRIAKNTGYLYLRMGISMFISLFTTRLILQSLGAEDFGIYNVVGGAIHMLGFLSAAMADPTQRFMSYYEGRGDKNGIKKVFNITVIMNICVSALVLVLFIVAGFWLFDGVLNIKEDRVFAAQIVYASLVISAVFSVISTPYGAVLNAHENMRYYAFVGIFESVLKLLVAIWVVYTSTDKLILYGILMAIIPIICFVIMLVYCNKNYEECVYNPKHYWDSGIAKDTLSFAGWSFVFSSLSMVGSHGLGIVLNHFYGAVLNAAQGISSQVNSLLLTLSKNLQKAVSPVITKREGAGERNSMISITISTSKLSYYLFSFFSIPIFFEASYILDLWLKDVPEWAVAFVRLQIIQNLLLQITMNFSVAIAAEGRIKWYNITTSIMWVLPLIFTFLLFNWGYGPLAMYYLTLVCLGVGINILNVYYFHRNCGMSYGVFVKELLIPVLIVTIVQVLTALLLTELIQSSFTRLVLTTISCIGVGCLAVYYIGVNDSEKLLIDNLMGKILKRIFRKA